jgi:hypothetical protein
MIYLRRPLLATLGTVVLLTFTAGTASATTLEVGGKATNGSVHVLASLVPLTSMLIKDESKNTVDTCINSQVGFETVSSFTGSTLEGPSSLLSFSGCTHTTTILNPGSIVISWTSGTNGTVVSKNAEFTVQSTFFGASAICKSGSGTDIGVITGSSSGGTIDVNAKLSCGILGSSSWTGTYVITQPISGLGVAN